MKKIAIVLNSSWGAYNFRLNLARALKKKGYKVIFIAPYDQKYSNILKVEFDFFSLNVDPKGLNFIQDLKILFSLFLLYKKESVDMTLNFTVKLNIYSSIASRLLNINSISNITGLGTVFIKKSLITIVVKNLYKIALRFNDKVFFQNKIDRKLFIENNLVLEEITGLLPGSGVDLNKFIPVKNLTNNNKIVFLVISRLIKDKGLLEYVEAIKIIKKQYNHVEFQLLGLIEDKNRTAISKEELQNWIDDGLISYLGSTDTVESVISQCDCVVLPSYREGLPRSLLEAGAMEKPVIATDIAGCRDIVDDGINGLLCKVKNSHDLADKINLMINLTNEQRLLMGKSGRAKVLEKFDENIVLNKYLASIEELFYEKDI
jgi:glycosyltransferase involved in cell wall biosynthesis